MADNAIARHIKQGQRTSFRATIWAAQLPIIRNERGQAIHALKKVAMVLASHADGETGENAFPGLERIAREAWLSSKKEAADVLHLGKEIGLWTEDEDESEWGTSIWHLAIDDLDLVTRLEADEERNQERKRQINADKQARHRARAKGEEEPTPRPAPKPRQSPVEPKVTPKAVVVQDAPDAPAEPRQRPNFGYGVPKHLAPEPEEEQNLGQQLIEYVMPKLDPQPTDARHARTVLMKFAARWPRCLEMAQIAVKVAESRPDDTIEIDCFEETYDPNFAIPLNNHIEKQLANPAA